MSRVCEGDQTAFAHLVHRHTDRYLHLAIRTLGDRAEAEDVVQTVFVALWQRPHQWNSRKSQFTTWFYQVVLNACRDVQRKSRRSEPLDTHQLEQALPAITSEQNRFEEMQESHELHQHLQRAITQLPINQRDAINLVVYCALSQQQVAEIMGVSVKALESLLSRAKQKLRAELGSLSLNSANIKAAATG